MCVEGGRPLPRKVGGAAGTEARRIAGGCGLWLGLTSVDMGRRAGLEGLSDGEFYVKLRLHLDLGARLYSLTLNPPEVAVWGAPVPGRID